MYQPPVQQQPRPFRWGRWALWTSVAAVAAFFIVGGVVRLANDHGGGGDSLSDPAACKAALAANYRRAMADPGGPSASEPAACVGLDQATLEKITGQVISEYGDSPEAQKQFEDDWRKAWESATASP